jgi:hypothetical protein
MFCRLRLFDSREVGRIFGPNKDEVTGEWRRLHNEELYNLYSPSIIFGVIKSITMRSVGDMVRMGDRRCLYRVSEGRA